VSEPLTISEFLARESKIMKDLQETRDAFWKQHFARETTLRAAKEVLSRELEGLGPVIAAGRTPTHADLPRAPLDPVDILEKLEPIVRDLTLSGPAIRAKLQAIIRAERRVTWDRSATPARP
jgi:hypothetical protein